MTNTINRNIIQNLPGLGVCWVVQHNGVFGQEIEKLLQSKLDLFVDFGTTPPPLIKMLVAAEELNDDQAHRLGKAEAAIKAIIPYADHNPACAKVVSGAYCDCGLEALIKEHNND